MEEKASVQQPKRSRLPLLLIALVLCAALLLGLWYAFSHKNAFPLTVSDPNYSFTVERAELDGEYACLLVTVKALNEKTLEALMSPDFGYGLGYFDLRVPGLEPRENFVFDQHSPGVGQISISQLSQTEDSRTIFLEPQLTVETDQLQVRLGLMEEGLSIVVPLTPLSSVTVDIGATGIGAVSAKTGELTSCRLQSVTLTPVGCTVSGSINSDTEPRLFFRMADGSVRTSAQMLSSFRRVSGTPYYRSRFLDHQDLKDIASVIVFDTEYPLDGSAPFPIEHDPSLDPVNVPRGEPLLELEEYYDELFPIQLKPLMEALGGTYEEDPVTGQITCTYRSVTVLFDPAAQEVTADGRTRSTNTLFRQYEEPIPLSLQAVQEGQPVIAFALARSFWQLDGFIPGDFFDTQESQFGDWYVIP